VICDDVTQHRAHHALAPVMLAIFNRTANRRGDQWSPPASSAAPQRHGDDLAIIDDSRRGLDAADQTKPAILDALARRHHDVTVGRLAYAIVPNGPGELFIPPRTMELTGKTSRMSRPARNEYDRAFWPAAPARTRLLTGRFESLPNVRGAE
jgi:hypothetical protein